MMNFYNSSKAFKKKIINLIIRNLSDEENLAYEDYFAKHQGRVNVKNNCPPDLILPQGCGKLGWTHFTVVEIEYHILYGTIKRAQFELGRREYHVNSPSLVIIYRYTPYAFLPNINDENLKVFTDQEFLSLLGYDKGEQGEMELLSNDEKLNKCKEAFKDGNCTLFLGAGVSMSAGLPGWSELLLRIKNNSNDKNVRGKDTKKVKQICDGATTIEARYLKARLEMSNSNKNYIDCVSEALYYRTANLDDELLNCVADLIDYKSPLEPKPKRRVKRVVTYNYDDLLECVLLKRKVNFEIRDGAGSMGKNFPIYHVHGIIQKYCGIELNTANWIVLSEAEYHELFNNQRKWANMRQYSFMTNSTCIFIGMSMTDPNLRRLLASTHGKNSKVHYAFLKRTILSNNVLTLDNEKTMDRIFLDLGVHIIWFDKFQDLPSILKNLFI